MVFLNNRIRFFILTDENSSLSYMDTYAWNVKYQNSDGTTYYRNGKIFRESGPAHVDKLGNKHYYVDGQWTTVIEKR